MGTIKEFYDYDFSNTFKINAWKDFLIDDSQVRLDCKLILDFNASVLYIAFYIPDNNLNLDFFKKLIDALKLGWSDKIILDQKFLIELPNLKFFPGKVNIGNMQSLKLTATFFGEYPIDYTNLVFSGRIFFYSETQLNEVDLTELKEIAKQNKFQLQFRSKIFAIENSAWIKPLAFISHDHRDKEKIAKPLAVSLSQKNCPVWYDEFSLEIGSNLRESIEKGIKECKRCVLILTPNFLSNNGWTKTEFESIFAWQIIEKKLIVLPIWSDVKSEEIFNYSPSLLNVYGLNWNEHTIEEISNKIVRVLFNDMEKEDFTNSQTIAREINI